MNSSRFDKYGMCLDEYQCNTANVDVYSKRATGELDEMECSKFLAEILARHVKTNQNILDVGCAVGHYYRSMKKRIKVPFFYTGVDPYSILIEKAKEIWKDDSNVDFHIGNIFDLPFGDNSFDYVVSNNVLLHLPDIVKPIGELLRVCKDKIIVRHLLYNKSYRIQFVYNNTWWPYTEVTPENEFDPDGNPCAFSYFNIHSFDYFSSVVHRHCPKATIRYIKDDRFAPEKINQSAKSEGFIEPTRVVDGMQISGCLILPNYFVEIKK